VTPTDKDKNLDQSVFRVPCWNLIPSGSESELPLRITPSKQRLARQDPSDDNHGEKRNLANASGNPRVIVVVR
jgi:hypothetical protein